LPTIVVILEDKIVRRHRAIGQETEDAYQFIELEENPIRVRSIAWGWFVVAAVSLILATWFVYSALRATRDPFVAGEDRRESVSREAHHRNRTEGSS
jgi:hypothetical protein